MTGLPPPTHRAQVLLLSARNALLSRLVLGGRASPDALKKFSRLAFGAFGLGAMGRAGPSQEQVGGWGWEGLGPPHRAEPSGD